ncbi:hypothetical protein PC128_g26627 [Phytophthora cactorum]|nr:hypothetical protein PC128_g26627 [Phytophthora cactorum]KAG4038211.1 hypothetical protein PC123_g26226 [Phytophthora cactorum]
MPPSLPSLECDPVANRQALACVRVVCRHGPDALRLHHVKLASYAMEPVDSSMRNPHFQQSQFSQGVTTAVRTGNLELIELLSTHFTGCSVPTKALQVAALLGNHDVFQWFVTHREDTEWDDSVVHHAVEGNHFELAQWLFERMASTRVRKIKRWAASAARKGNLDMIKWIWSLSENIKLQQAMQDAVDFGHLEVLEWIMQQLVADANGYSFCSIDLDRACLNEHIAVVEWVICHFPELAYISFADWDAARVGQLDLVKLLHSNNVDGCSRSAIRSAAAHNNFDIVKWLISCEHKSVLEIGSYFPIDGAACNGHFEMVKWLHEHTPEACSHSAMDRAAARGDIDVVQWLHENRSEGCSTLAMDVAARVGNLQIVQWLSENRTEGCTTSAMDNAAYYGHIEVVKWLHDNRREGCTVDAMNLAARNGHLDVVKWLHLNRTEGCTTAAMDCAADRGHLDVVQWLAENRSEGCTTIALDGAVINKHRAVADWLLRNRSEGGTAAIMAAIAARGDIEAVYWCHFVAQVTYDATAADAAVRNGHFAIARFLHEYREWNECDIIRALRECPYSNRRWEFAEWMYWHHRDELESMVEDIFADL